MVVSWGLTPEQEKEILDELHPFAEDIAVGTKFKIDDMTYTY